MQYLSHVCSKFAIFCSRSIVVYFFLQSLFATRSVTNLTETLMAQVPEKQKKLAELKKNHEDHV
jgi:ABC-type oligopeptide transport system ATPase subunit